MQTFLSSLEELAQFLAAVAAELIAILAAGVVFGFIAALLGGLSVDGISATWAKAHGRVGSAMIHVRAAVFTVHSQLCRETGQYANQIAAPRLTGVG